MTEVTGMDILAALMNDPAYVAQPESVRLATEPFILAIPDVLADFLDQEVTFQTLMEAKGVFISYCLQNGYVDKVVASTPEDVMSFLTPPALRSRMRESLEMALELLEDLLADFQAFLEENGVTADQLLTSPQGLGRYPALLELYQAGTLTIGDVLLSHPEVIVKNTK